MANHLLGRLGAHGSWYGGWRGTARQQQSSLRELRNTSCVWAGAAQERASSSSPCLATPSSFFATSTCDPVHQAEPDMLSRRLAILKQLQLPAFQF